MSAATDFRAGLLAHAPLVALVGQDGVAENAMVGQKAPPFVVFVQSSQPKHTLDNGVAPTRHLFSVQCWGESSQQAHDVALAVEAAVQAMDAGQVDGVEPLSALCVEPQGTAFDEELGLDAEQLTVEWWAQP